MKYNLSEYKIRAFISDGETFIKGKQDFETGNIIGIKVIDCDEQVISAEVEGTRGKKYSVKIFFDENGELLNTICTCCHEKCRHTVSALFEAVRLQESDEEIVVEIEKKSVTKKLFNDFSKFGLKYKNIKANRNVSFYPYFAVTDLNRINVGFFIGVTIMQKIDNIFEFYQNMKNGGTYYINKNVGYQKEQIKKEYIKYIDFIGRQVENYNDFSENAEEILFRDCFELGKNGTDEFFSINQDDITYFDNNTFKTIHFENSRPDLSILFEKKDVGFRLYHKWNNFVFIEGLDFGYIIDNMNLYKMDKEKFEVLKSLSDTFIISENDEIIVPQNEVDRLISNVIPVLEENGFIKNVDETYKLFDISKPQAEFYFDSNKKTISVEIKFVFDKYSVFQNIFQSKIEEMLFDIGFEYKNGYLYEMKDDDDIYDLYNGNIEKVKKFGEVFLSENFENKKIKVYKNAMKEVRVYGGLLEIDFDLNDFDFSEAQKILEAYRLKKKYFRLKDGDFIDLKNSTLEPALEVIDSFELDREDIIENKISVPVYNAFYLNNVISKGNYGIKTDDVYDELINRFKKIDKNGYSIPSGLNGELRDYQKKGFFWLKTLASFNFGGILADDMGLGKTIQVITLILSDLEESSEKNKSIVICPTSLIYNWKNEIKKFAPNLDCKVIAGNPELRHEMIANDEFAGVFITTYDLLKRDLDYYSDFEFKFIIADEAQNIKNPFTQNSKAVKMLKGEVRFALTGTPIENSLAELWSIFDFVMPTYLGSKKRFRTDFEIPIIKHEDSSISSRLKNKTMPFILRRIKKDVLKELPEKSETVLYCDMQEKQRRIYAANLIEAKNDIQKFISDGEFDKKKMKILAYITRLRQLCCHPALFINDYDGGSGKLELVMETIKNVIESGHRVLLFSQFTSMLNIIKNELIKESIDFFYIDGKTNSAKRISMTERFNEGENDVFLISLKAGGTGLNLTGADVVIHFDPWWNPAVMDQASDRAYRLGQVRNVQVFYVVAKNTIEEKIIELQNKKKELVKSIISDDGEIAIGNMSKEDILSIFNE